MIKSCFFKFKYYLIIIILLKLNIFFFHINNNFKKIPIKNILNNSKCSFNIEHYKIQNLFKKYQYYQIGDNITIFIKEYFHTSNNTLLKIINKKNHRFEIQMHPHHVLNTKFFFQAFIKYFKKCNIIEMKKNIHKNIFTGKITTTIINIYPNGNLKIFGEKKIYINKHYEILQISGIINPKMINIYNIISSNFISHLNIKYLNKNNISKKHIF